MLKVKKVDCSISYIKLIFPINHIINWLICLLLHSVKMYILFLLQN